MLRQAQLRDGWMMYLIRRDKSHRVLFFYYVHTGRYSPSAFADAAPRVGACGWKALVQIKDDTHTDYFRGSASSPFSLGQGAIPSTAAIDFFTTDTD
jgi:hypothetical protein